RVPQVHREGRRARAALPDRDRGSAVGGRDGGDPARPPEEVRGPSPRDDPRLHARDGVQALGALHHRPLPPRQGDRRDRRSAQAPPPEVAELKAKLEGVNGEKEAAVRDQNFEKAAALRDRERELQGEIRKQQEDWEKRRQSFRPVLGEEEIAFIVSRWTGIPVTRLQEAESARLMRMEEELHESVVGQDEAIKALSRSIRRSRARLKDPHRPIGSFIFSGPTGVGKTELARALAKFLFADPSALIRVDMSEYMEKFSVSRLIGAPPGYVGYEDSGT